jgi:hypothetical protein
MIIIKIEIHTESSTDQLMRMRSRTASLTQGIGIVSSIDYDVYMSTSFDAGLAPLVPSTTPSAGQVYINVQDDLGYQTSQIQTAIQDLNSDSTIGLIITIGGLVTWTVAAQYATKPFISLIGGQLPNTPQPPSSYYYGAVSLDSFKSNPGRLKNLVKTKPKVKNSEVWLLNDPRTSMASTEGNGFPGGGVMPATNGINDPTKFGSDFTNIKTNGGKAVVISAAPYFYENMEPLIEAANTSDLYVCYPLLDYANIGGKTQPTPATLFGPALCEAAGNKYGVSNAYGLLGTMANQVLSGQSANPAFTSAPTPPNPIYL